MKKIFSLVLVILMIACALVSCKKTCEACEEDFSGKGYKVEFRGEEMLVCEDCYEDIKPWLDIAEGIGDLFS